MSNKRDNFVSHGPYEYKLRPCDHVLEWIARCAGVAFLVGVPFLVMFIVMDMPLSSSWAPAIVILSLVGTGLGCALVGVVLGRLAMRVYHHIFGHPPLLHESSPAYEAFLSTSGAADGGTRVVQPPSRMPDVVVRPGRRGRGGGSG